MRRQRLVLACTVLLTAGLALSGCASGDDMPNSTETAGMPAASVEEPMLDMAAESDRGMGPGGAVSTVADEQRQVIRTAYMALRVDDVVASLDQVRDLVAATNGIISSESSGTDGSDARATVTAQVPAAQLETFLDDVGALGSVDSLDVSAQDVTLQVVDLDARIAVLETSIERLTDLLIEADRVEDLVAVESELSRRQADLDSLQSQRTWLSEQVALSSVTVTLTPRTHIADVEVPGFLSGLQSGWSALLTTAGALVTMAGFLLPFLVVLLVIAVPVVLLIVRRQRRRRRVGT